MERNEIEILFRQHYNQMIQLARMMLISAEESRGNGERSVCHIGKDGQHAEER